MTMVVHDICSVAQREIAKVRTSKLAAAQTEDGRKHVDDMVAVSYAGELVERSIKTLAKLKETGDAAFSH